MDTLEVILEEVQEEAHLVMEEVQAEVHLEEVQEAVLVEVHQTESLKMTKQMKETDQPQVEDHLEEILLEMDHLKKMSFAPLEKALETEEGEEKEEDHLVVILMSLLVLP